MTTVVRDRYVVFRILSDSIFSLSKLKSVIWQRYQLIYGLNGTSEAGLYFDFFSEEEQVGLIRCTHDSLPNLMTILAIISEIDTKPLIIYSLFVSGTVKKAKKILSFYLEKEALE